MPLKKRGRLVWWTDWWRLWTTGMQLWRDWRKTDWGQQFLIKPFLNAYWSECMTILRVEIHHLLREDTTGNVFSDFRKIVLMKFVLDEVRSLRFFQTTFFFSPWLSLPCRNSTISKCVFPLFLMATFTHYACSPRSHWFSSKAPS